MLKRHRASSERLCVWWRDRLIHQRAATQDLNPQLQRISASLAKNPGVKIEIVRRSDRCSDSLRESVALKIAAGTECGRVRATGCAFGVVGYMRGNRPTSDGAVGTERGCLEVTVRQ